MAERLVADEEVHELKLGQSFEPGGRVAYHSMYFDFKPASIDTLKPAVIDIQQGNKVTVTVPHIEGSSTKQTVYCGSKQPCQKDYALIINHDTGEIVLEKLTYKLNVKRTRAERPKEVRAPVEKQPKTSAENVTQAVSAPPATFAARNDVGALPNVTQGQDVSKMAAASFGDLSASSSSEAESSSSDSSDSSDSEDETNARSSAPEASRQPMRSLPASNLGFSVINDLQLSESDSD